MQIRQHREAVLQSIREMRRTLAAPQTTKDWASQLFCDAFDRVDVTGLQEDMGLSELVEHVVWEMVVPALTEEEEDKFLGVCESGHMDKLTLSCMERLAARARAAAETAQTQKEAEEELDPLQQAEREKERERVLYEALANQRCGIVDHFGDASSEEDFD